MAEMDLHRLQTQLQECIKEGYGNARTPIDWFHVGLPLISVALAAQKYRACKHQQAALSAHDPSSSMICRHVVYNGGVQPTTCAAELFTALDALGAVAS
jgi:hypothetical protein